MIYSYSCDFSSWVTGLTAWVHTLWGPSVMWLYLAWRGEVWRCIWVCSVELLLLTQLCPRSHLWAPVCQVVFSTVTMSTQEFCCLVSVGWECVNYFIFRGIIGILFRKSEHESELTIWIIYLDGLLDLKCYRCFPQKWTILMQEICWNNTSLSVFKMSTCALRCWKSHLWRFHFAFAICCFSVRGKICGIVKSSKAECE